MFFPSATYLKNNGHHGALWLRANTQNLQDKLSWLKGGWPSCLLLQICSSPWANRKKASAPLTSLSSRFSLLPVPISASLLLSGSQSASSHLWSLRPPFPLSLFWTSFQYTYFQPFPLWYGSSLIFIKLFTTKVNISLSQNKCSILSNVAQ